MQASHSHPVTCRVAGVFLRARLEPQCPELQVQGPRLLTFPGHLRVARHSLTILTLNAALSEQGPDDQTLAAVKRILLLLELPHDPQHDPPVPLRQANDLAEYGARALVPKRLHQLLVE